MLQYLLSNKPFHGFCRPPECGHNKPTDRMKYMGNTAVELACSMLNLVAWPLYDNGELTCYAYGM